MIRKNAKVFALVLAIVMMLSTAAFAAEGDHFVNGKLKYSANQVRADVSAKNHVRVAPSEFQIEVEGKLYDLADANAAYEEDKANWKEILKGEDPSEDLKVVEVSAITSTYVEVTFDALAEAQQEVTLTVKDNTGAVVEVVATDLAAGATFAQFNFVKEYEADQVGVWTVNGIEYDFDDLAKAAAIVEAANDGDQVKLYNLLIEAGIENVNDELIATYVTDIVGATEKETLAEIQAIIVSPANASSIVPGNVLSGSPGSSGSSGSSVSGSPAGSSPSNMNNIFTILSSLSSLSNAYTSTSASK